MIRVVIVLAGLLSACVAPAAAPTVTPSAAAVVSAAPTSSATPAPSATFVSSGLPPNPALSSHFASAALGYRVDLPAPWRLACRSNGTQRLGDDPVADFFTATPEASERWGDIGYPFDVAYVSVRPNPDRFTAQQWIANDRLGGCCVAGAGPNVVPATLDGRAAVTFSGSGPFGDLSGLVVPAGDRMYEIAGVAMQPPANVVAMAAIVRSFHFLTDTERAALPRPTSAPPRSAQAVADALAAGFAANDIAALAAQVDRCLTIGALRGGLGAVAAAAFVDDLRSDLASGRRVSVTASPILEYGADVFVPSGTRYVRSTWTRRGLDAQSVDLLLRADGDRWYWVGTLARGP
jgi:hypothetical protein